MPVLKMTQIRRKILVERVLPNRNVIYIVSLTVTFQFRNTLHASRFQLTFSNELITCRLQNFHPQYMEHLYLETLTLNLQLFPNASFKKSGCFLREKFLERILTNKRVIYIDSIAGNFRDTITLYA